MNARIVLSSVFAAAIIPTVLVNGSASADDGNVLPAKVDSGPHGYEGATEITPRLQKKYPGIGTLKSKYSETDLQRGESELATGDGAPVVVDE